MLNYWIYQWLLQRDKRAMILNYFQVIHITIEKIIIGTTQPAHDVPETSPECLLKVLTSRNCKRPSGDSQGTNTKMMILWKTCFTEVIVLALYICFCFLQEEQIFKSYKRGPPRDVYGTQLRDVKWTKWWDVLRTSVGFRANMSFKLKSQILEVDQDFIVNGSREKFSEHYSG